MQRNNVVPVTDNLGEATKQAFRSFLEEFNSYAHSSDHDGTSFNRDPDYLIHAQTMAENNLRTLVIDYHHLLVHNTTLADLIAIAFYRLEPYLNQALEGLMYDRFLDIISASAGEKPRPFQVSFQNYPVVSSIRDLKTHKVGSLVSVIGTVTRTTQARPELVLGTFKCLDCDSLIYNIKQQFKFTQPVICPRNDCGNKTRFSVVAPESHFADWQQLRLQETTADIPAGSMPRSLSVILRNDLVEATKPGDKVVITGTLIVVPDVNQLSKGSVSVSKERGRIEDGDGLVGLKELGVRDLSYRLCLLASTVTQTEPNVESSDSFNLSELSLQERELLLKLRAEPENVRVNKILSSVAPNIFGHAEIKKGILLMLLGGVRKVTPDRQNLRGDINVCIVGDPSTSKSQFLKWVCTFMPRAVYTSGKASSAAGLTASVARDPESGEFTIEAGALMLADNGVCCIDEFDKMDAKDQSAIHEAMEQQTISISKAGIQATLNARASIVAAANPIGGRYDRSRTLKQNVDISPPIMSRFDLFFVVLDEGEETIDTSLARHIVSQHATKVHQAVATAHSLAGTDPNYPIASALSLVPSADRPADAPVLSPEAIDSAIKATLLATTANIPVVVPPLDLDTLRSVVRSARLLQPTMTEGARRALIDRYEAIRASDAGGASRSAYRITVRQLESLIRLSEATARLYLDVEVTEKHVHEAAQMLEHSIVSILPHDVRLDMMSAGPEMHNDAFGGDDDDDDGDDNDNDNGNDGNNDDNDSDRDDSGSGSRRRTMNDDDDNDDEDNDNEGDVEPKAKKMRSSSDVEKKEKKSKKDKKDKKFKKDKKDKKDKTSDGKDGSKSSKTRSLPFKEYNRLSSLIVMYMTQRQSYDEDPPTREELINWLFSQMSSTQTLDLQEAKEARLTAQLVVKRLIEKDRTLFAVNNYVALHPRFDTTGTSGYADDARGQSTRSQRDELADEEEDMRQKIQQITTARRETENQSTQQTESTPMDDEQEEKNID